MPSNARGVASEIEQVKSFRAIRYEMCIQVGVACPIKGATAWGMAAGHTDAAVIKESPPAQTGQSAMVKHCKRLCSQMDE